MKTVVSLAKVLVWFIAASSQMFVTVTFAATLTVQDGILLGASNVIVDGKSYNVTFTDGTCIGVFGGCNEVSDFNFKEYDIARAAAQAILDQVFVDSSKGQFDSNPTLTYGCSFYSCGAHIPWGFGQGPIDFHPGELFFNFLSAFNEPPGDSVADYIWSWQTRDFSNTATNIDNGNTQTFAIFTPTDKPLPPQQQTLYLDFLGGNVPQPPALSWLIPGSTFYKPDAGLSLTEIETVIGGLKAIFHSFNIQFTSELPTQPLYSTVYIGGSAADMGSSLSIKQVGLAQHVDFDNKIKNDIAHVFSAAIPGPDWTREDFLNGLTIAVAHEAAHNFGLLHLARTSELMYPSISGYKITDEAIRTTISSAALRMVRCQNGHQALGRSIGFVDGSLPTGMEDCEKPIKAFGSLVTLDDVAIYGARLLAFFDDDAGPTVFELGDLSPGNGFGFSAEFPEPLSYTIIGSTTPGGAIDTIASSLSAIEIGDLYSLADLDLAALNNEFSLGSEEVLNLYRFDDQHGLALIGEVKSVFVASVPVPATLSLLGIGFAGLGFSRRKQ